MKGEELILHSRTPNPLLQASAAGHINVQIILIYSLNANAIVGLRLRFQQISSQNKPHPEPSRFILRGPAHSARNSSAAQSKGDVPAHIEE